MSRGPGRIENGVLAVFNEEPNNAFTVEDLVERIYRWVGRVERRHRVAMLRSAKKVCLRSANWTWLESGGVGGSLVFFSPYNVMSYAAARIKGEECGNNYRVNDPRRLGYPHWKSLTDDDVKDCLAPGESKHHTVVEGGAWWRHVQMAIVERDKDCSPEALKLFEDLNRARVICGAQPIPLPGHFTTEA